YVEVSLEEAALTGLINQASNYLMAGHVAKPMGTLHPNIAPYGETFTCADGKMVILAVGSDQQFKALCHVLKLLELAHEPSYASNTGRVKYREALAKELQLVIGNLKQEELLEHLLTAGVPAGAVRSMNEVMATPAAQAMIAEE